VKIPFASFEPVGGAPPIPAKLIGAAIHNVRAASGKLGTASAVVCYFGSHFTAMVCAFCSTSAFFQGWGWRFIAGCASALENHLSAYAWCIYGLCVAPSIVSLIVRLLGGGEATAGQELAGPGIVKSPSPFTHRIVAFVLLIPCVQVLVGALAGLTTVALILAFLTVHASAICRRYTEILHIWMRAAAKLGWRNSLGSRSQ